MPEIIRRYKLLPNLLVLSLFFTLILIGTAFAESLPPERFLNFEVGVEYRWGPSGLNVTVRNFISAQQQDSRKFEQDDDRQWICRFYYTDKLTRLKHELSILFKEVSDPEMAVIARVLLDEREFGELEKIQYGTTVAHKYLQDHPVNAETPLMPSGKKDLSKQPPPSLNGSHSSNKKSSNKKSSIDERYIEGEATKQNMEESPVGAKADANSKDLTWLSKALNEWIANLDKHYPIELRRTGVEGNVILSGIINKDGVIHDYHIEKSSGNELLDKAALEDVGNGDPVSLSHQLPRDEIKIKFSLTYSLGGHSR